jgi:hypothetical protein
LVFLVLGFVSHVGPLLLRFQLCWVSLCGFILLVRSTIDVPFSSLFFPLKISAFMSCFVLFYDVIPLWMFQTSSLLLLVMAGWVLKKFPSLVVFAFISSFMLRVDACLKI